MRTKVLLTLAVTALILGLLWWQNAHGGVPSHHLLQQEDLPEISNWWGVLLLPFMTWISISRIQRRTQKTPTEAKSLANQTFKIIGLFLTGLALAVALVVAFMNDFKPFLDNVPYLFLLLSLVVPIYYSEFILGFVLGMTYTFGALLPTAFIAILATIGFLLYRFVRPLFLRMINSK